MPRADPGTTRACCNVALLAAIAACALLAACVAETSGPPLPPPEFGKVASSLLGCPAVEGVYAWPPAAGAHAGRMATNREPWAGGIPVPVSRGEMQLWISRDRGLLTVRSRRVNRQANVRDGLARGWSYAEYDSSMYTCSSGLLDVEPIDVETGEDYGGKGIRRGFRLALLRDRSLAVGIRTIAFGRTGALFSWADVSRGTYAMRDKTYWSWSKLARIGPGDVEPAPIDAGAAPP